MEVHRVLKNEKKSVDLLKTEGVLEAHQKLK